MPDVAKSRSYNSLAEEIQPGEVISYTQMCSNIGVNLQRGMNFRLRAAGSVILMSLRPGGPYADSTENEGRVLIYEGHDVPRTVDSPHPKQVDQPERNPGGSLAQNGLFAEAVRRHKQRHAPPERVRVYEKIRAGIWVYNGLFELIDCWNEMSGGRRVFKFKLQLVGVGAPCGHETLTTLEKEDDRLIPSWVKLEVWKRDQGRCVQCGIKSGLHFDHIIPYSKGGSSKDPANIQILCGRHNLAKHDKIE